MMTLLLIAPVVALTQPKTNGLTVGPAANNLDTTFTNQLVAAINAGNYPNTHSVLILKNDRLVFEEYFDGFEAKHLHSIRSITKGITAMLLGIALDQGQIASVDDIIWKYLPDHKHLRNEANQGVTIHHLLTMTPGWAWNESDVSYNDEENDENRMYADGRWVDFTLEKPMTAEPGTTFRYSGGTTNVLAMVIQNAVGERLDKFARKHLFKPLNIKKYEWHLDEEKQLVSANAGLELTPRDMVKVGQLLLNGGIWEGRQVIGSEYIDQLSMQQTDGGPMGPFLLDYGYMVLVIRKGPDFMPGLTGFASTGNGGQIIWVLPHEDAVIVMTGGNYNSELSQLQPIELAIKYIYPALASKP